ncbi:hypothetical protein ACKI1I_36345 [Streptomyces turgidiscabies]|uniref:Putative lipoprotein n=1 Tax=Streptomyces turgidiscabies (strain Car8) TaxID=698760 RepID=L7F0N9_STRT8|nr:MULTISPECIES: hypothetical protein [Streptomyces]ELP64704.1 putative lipoprotein [Streptomyces turgidiscabies Car8]MDX3491617.1 hypothetical protein [Streptomyces turgidiscabies]GAQ73222.1 hypothetical protein T45_04980 [Streptomyces turgidiscabies]
MSARTTHRTRRFGTAVILLAVTAGCAQGQAAEPASAPPRSGLPTASGPPPVIAVPKMLDVSSLVLPVEAYLFTDRQVGRLFRAKAVLTESCMRRFGHSWPAPTGPIPETGTLNPANTAHRYGITDAAKAARYGYHPVPGSVPPQVRNKPSMPQPAPEAMLVLRGSNPDGTPTGTDSRGRRLPAGGCQSEATKALSGDPQKLGNAELVSAVNIGSYRDSQRDPRVVAVFRAWSRCMERQNSDYTFADPTRTPGKDPEFKGVTAGRSEVALASTDVACKRETNVIGVWSTVDAAYQRRAMAEKQREFAAVKKDMRTQLANADQALAGRR